MKKIFFVNLIAASLGLFYTGAVNAQDTTSVGQDIKNGAKKTGHAVKQAAKKVGNKTAEVASKGSSKIVDKVYDGKVGPNGEKIYINDKSQYYWVDKKGHRQYIAETELKDKNN